MKHSKPALLLTIGLFCLLLGPTLLFGQEKSQGIRFFEGTMQEAVAKATQQKKNIFFDAYASWCGPCKFMDSEIFTRPDVADFFNNNFICVRIDMEKGEGPALKKIYFSIDGYPSMLFLGSDGRVIKTLLGSRSGIMMIEEGKLSLIN